MWGETIWVQQPVKDINTYKRMISLAIAERDLHHDLSPSFRLCIPLQYLIALSIHFPTYKYDVLGGCFQDHNARYVQWHPAEGHEKSH